MTFVDNAAIAELNNQYRNKPMPTDVLSFPLGENGVYDVDENNGCKMLGDIVISMERAQEQATLYGHPLQREVAFLTVHSMLHLLGYDHENGGLEAMRMREKEEAVLIQLGLPRTVSLHGIKRQEFYFEKRNTDPRAINDTSSVFVAVIGRPNVGKSSLTNLLVGEKVAIVTSKPQTTRTVLLASSPGGLCSTFCWTLPAYISPTISWANGWTRRPATPLLTSMCP